MNKIFNIKNINYNNTTVLNYMFIMYAFVIPISRAGIVFFSFLIIGFFLFHKEFLTNLSFLKKNKVFISFSLFVGFYILSLLWTNIDNFKESLADTTKYWYILPSFVIFLKLRKKNILILLTSFSLGMLVSEIFSYGIFFELFSYKNVSPNNPTPFMIHLDYSIFLSFTALLTLNRILFEKSNKHKLLYMFFFISLTINLFITGGRSGQLAFFISLIVLFLYFYENKLKALLLSSLLGIAIFFSAYTFSDLFNQRLNSAVQNIQSIVENKNYCSSWGMRVGAIIIAKDIVMQHPFIGVGTTDNTDVLSNIIKNKHPDLKCMNWFEHFHNQYLEVITEIGIIGLLIFLYFLYTIFKIPLQNKEFSVIKILLLSIFCIGFISEPFFHKQFTMALFALMLGIILSQSRIEKEDNNMKQVRE